MSEQDLAKWLKRQALDIHVAEEEPQPLSRLDLVHTIEGEGFEKLETMRVTDDTDMTRMSQEIYSAADHDASTRTSGQVQRYVVLAFRGEEDKSHYASHSFVIRVSQSKLFIGGDSEPPTEKGAVAHYMRHDENMHRLMMQTQESLLGRVASELTRETEKRNKAEDRVEQMKEREQDLLDRSFDRELLRAKNLQQAKFFAELGGLVTAVAPLVLGRLLAGKEGVMAPNARDLSIQKFLKNLSEDEIKGILGSLKAPNQISLMEIYQSYAESEKAAEAKKERMLRDGEQEKEEGKEEGQAQQGA